MSKVLGLDIASSTGWCILNDNRLEKYGVITIPSEMNLFQRLKYFENNLNQILQENSPDSVHIEDVILGISGAKTLAYLGRLNGVAISVCYNKVGDNIKLYTPTFWKSHSFPNLNGLSKKAEIQVAIIKYYNLISEQDLPVLIKPLTIFNEDCVILETKINNLKDIVEKAKRSLSRVRNKLDPKTEEETRKTLKTSEKDLTDLKKALKLKKKEIDNVCKQVSISLTAKCGLTTDVCDSIGIAYCNV